MDRTEKKVKQNVENAWNRERSYAERRKWIKNRKKLSRKYKVDGTEKEVKQNVESGSNREKS